MKYEVLQNLPTKIPPAAAQALRSVVEPSGPVRSYVTAAGRHLQAARTQLSTYYDAGHRDERAFLPAAIEIVETPPSPTIRATATAIIVLLTLIFLWAVFGRVDIVAVARGKITPVGQIKTVQPLETSVIRALHVLEGHRVAAGQKLIDLDPTDPSASLETARTEWMQAVLDAEAARVNLAGDPASFHVPSDVDPVLAKAKEEQTRLTIDEHRAALASIRAERLQKEAALASNAAQLAKNSELLPLVTERYQTLKGLFERAVGSRPQMVQAQLEMIERQAEGKMLGEQRRQLEADLQALDERSAQLTAQYRARHAEQRVRALQQAAMVEQNLRRQRERESLRRLTAPVEGTVHNLKVHTLGAVVTTADVLMTIVPKEDVLEMEALIDQTDIGFVREGQAVEIKLDAFPFTRHGTIPGRVRYVSPYVTEMQGEREGQSRTGFRILVTVENASLKVNGVDVPLTPGMAAQAELKLGKRRIISFLLDPIVQHVAEAGRER